MEVVDARIQRLKRAMDLSMKHQYLIDDLQVRNHACSSLCKLYLLLYLQLGNKAISVLDNFIRVVVLLGCRIEFRWIHMNWMGNN